MSKSIPTDLEDAEGKLPLCKSAIHKSQMFLCILTTGRSCRLSEHHRLRMMRTCWRSLCPIHTRMSREGGNVRHGDRDFHYRSAGNLKLPDGTWECVESVEHKNAIQPVQRITPVLAAVALKPSPRAFRLLAVMSSTQGTFSDPILGSHDGILKSADAPANLGNACGWEFLPSNRISSHPISFSFICLTCFPQQELSPGTSSRV